MKYTIDTESAEIITDGRTKVGLYSKEGFELLSRLWLKVAWNQKYTYTFTWLGRPIIQLPEDMIRVQEVIHRLAPDVILETGIAHGGSLVFYASLCRAMGKGRVIGVDIDVRPHNRAALEQHPLIDLITIIEGSSIDPEVASRVSSLIQPGETVLVLLDSNHTADHVRAELAQYSRFVTPDSYIVVTDGIMKDVADTPRGQPEWASDNPIWAIEEFVAAEPSFVVEQPPWPFNESELDQNFTHWPQAYLRRVR